MSVLRGISTRIEIIEKIHVDSEQSDSEVEVKEGERRRKEGRKGGETSETWKQLAENNAALLGNIQCDSLLMTKASVFRARGTVNSMHTK